MSVTPLVAAKRGRRGSGAYAGVDGHVQLDAFEGAPADPADDGIAPGPYRPPPFAIDTSAIRVAVVDVSFGDLAALPRPAEGPIRVGLPDDAPDERAAALAEIGLGHGTAMAGVVQATFSGAHVGLFEIAGVAGAARAYLAPADLAAAVATAVEAWQADVVLIAMSDGAWGTPRYLRDVLREAARCGRGGRGTPIVVSVGDPSRNHPRQDDTAALGADDLASQPWVQAIAACDERGGWYRVYPGYHCAGGPPANGNGGPGATYNRLGPAVALAAPGEPTRWSEHIAADDSSQASALAAAAVARVLDANRDLSATELRALMALTADVPAVVDGGTGLAAGAFDARDRLGHNFKTGHGPVNVPAACLAAADPIALALLATRPVPDPAGESKASALARAWLAAVHTAADGGVSAARDYLQISRCLSRLFLTALPVQEALCWLARHVRALAESARPAFWQGQDHGALAERIRHAIDTAWDAGDVSDTDAAQLQALDDILAAPGAETAVSTVLARVFCPDVMAADGGQGGARSIALAGDAVRDRRGRRGPRRAGGGDVRERPPVAGPSVSRAVHRSPR
jgi:hypothetical protein